MSQVTAPTSRANITLEEMLGAIERHRTNHKYPKKSKMYTAPQVDILHFFKLACSEMEENVNYYNTEVKRLTLQLPHGTKVFTSTVVIYLIYRIFETQSMRQTQNDHVFSSMTMYCSNNECHSAWFENTCSILPKGELQMK